MEIFKTNLVQAIEEIREVDEMVAIINSYRDKIVNSMAVPTKMLGRDMSIDSGSENYLTMFPDKPTLIKIDITKIP